MASSSFFVNNPDPTSLKEIDVLLEEARDIIADIATQAGVATAKAAESSSSATSALNSATAAATSANAAASSVDAVAASAASAQASATTATNQAIAAANSASAAGTSATNAQTSATAAATSATNAGNSATAAATSATNASGSATTATTRAGEASASATAAATSATNAGNSATAAATSATNAANSASSALSHANDADADRIAAQTARTGSEAARDSSITARDASIAARDAAQGFRNEAQTARNDVVQRYRGPEAAPLAAGNFVGQLVFDTTNSIMRQWNGTAWVATVSTSIGGVVSEDFVATAGQTTINVAGGFTAIDIWHNGVVLVRNVDYTVASPNVTFTFPLAAGDRIAARGHRALDATDYPTRAEANSTYITRAQRFLRNRVLNPAMQISQENFSNAGNSPGYWPVDGWQWAATVSGMVGFIQQVSVVTPGGSTARIRLTITTGKGTLAAGEHCGIQQAIEGIEITDFRWGTASARQVILRFGFAGPAGTYTGAIRNSAADRSYPFSFVVPSGQGGVDRLYEFVIPGDTTGTWHTGTLQGLSIYIALASSATFTGSGQVWQSGNRIAPFSNPALIAGTYDLFDVGLYLDELNMGVTPRFEVPEWQGEMRRCMRYWQEFSFTMYSWGASTTNVANYTFPVVMRASPSMSNRPNPYQAGVNTITNDVANGRGGRYVISSTSMGSAEWTGVLIANARI